MNSKIENDDKSGKRDQTLYEKIQDLGMNVLFNLSGWSMRTPAPFDRDSVVYFQGRNVNRKKDILKQSQEELLKRFSGVIWMTYRKNFPALLKGIPASDSKDSNYISDTGWGCTVRVGQMAFAEALRRHLSETSDKKFKVKQDLQCIINGFLDDDEDNPDIAPYSIQKISKLGFEEFQIFPGHWYKPNHVCYILGVLHNERQCIPGTENLKVALFSSSLPIYFEDFLERMCKNNPSKNKRNTICDSACRKINIKQPSSAIQNNIDDPYLLVISEQAPQQRLVCPIHHELEFSMLVFIVCVIGMDTPEIEYLNMAIKMMDFKYSLGMIGGKPKKALYFVGRIDDNFIILDPHFVQEGSSRYNIVKQSQLDTYFCNKFQTFPSKNIDTSFSLMYYFKDLSQLEEFYQFIQKLKIEYPEHFFIMFEDSNKQRNSNIISTNNLKNYAEKQKQKKQKSTETAAITTSSFMFNSNFEEFDDETEKPQTCITAIKQSKQQEKQEEQEDDFEII